MSTEERVSTYRDRLAEAIKQSVIARSGNVSFNESGLIQAAYQDADAVLAVPNPELDTLSTENERLAAERQRMLDEWHKALRSSAEQRRRAERAERELSEAKKKIEGLSSSLDRVREHAYHQRRTSQGRITDYVKADEIIAILDNPPPGDTP